MRDFKKQGQGEKYRDYDRHERINRNRFLDIMKIYKNYLREIL